MNNNRLIMIGAIVLGLVFVGLALLYWTTPANALPVFIPGYDPALTRIHTTHGLLMLALGVGSFVLAWFQSGRKSAA
jgi:hypothetical protein